MSRFKAGDKVVKKAREAVGEWDKHPFVTVKCVEGYRVWAVETDTWFSMDCIELYNDVQGKRDELEAAIKLVQGYGVQVGVDLLYCPGKISTSSLTEVLDHLLPLETPQQKEMKELEAQQRDLADRMEKLRSQL